MNVFTFQYETCCGDTLVSVYDSLDAVITRIKLMQLHGNFDEHESFTVRCEEVVDNDEMQERFKRIKKHYESK